METKDADAHLRNTQRSAVVASSKQSPRKRCRSNSLSLETHPPSRRKSKRSDGSSMAKVDTEDSKKPPHQGATKQPRQNVVGNGRRGKVRRRNQNRSRTPNQQKVLNGNVVVIATQLPESASGNQTLQWQTIHPRVSIQSEQKMLRTLIRWNEKERGMMRNAGDRYKNVKHKCKQVGMHLSQALSLRRQFIHHLNPHLGMRALGLGKDEDIRQSAALFESAVEQYLQQCQVKFLTEQQQKARCNKATKSPPTPDFMLTKPTLLSTVVPVEPHEKPSIQNFVIHWVEAKMFYGASCIANGSKSAVGSILSKSETYVELYGTGAMVFMYGCGKEMAEWLLQRGVVALDAHPLDLKPVERHQRTWCGSESGLILP